MSGRGCGAKNLDSKSQTESPTPRGSKPARHPLATRAGIRGSKLWGSPHSLPPWGQPRVKSMVSLINSHTNAARVGWHLWEIDLRFADQLPTSGTKSPSRPFSSHVPASAAGLLEHWGFHRGFTALSRWNAPRLLHALWR